MQCARSLYLHMCMTQAPAFEYRIAGALACSHRAEESSQAWAACKDQSAELRLS